MVVDDKIQEAKECFKTINQSGRNNYQKYNYFETRDIFPLVRQVCMKYKLKTKFDWNREENMMTLTIKDKEDGTIDTTRIPVAPITTSDPGKYMQDVGRIQTYAMRYLYIQVFEIAVPDEIDNRDQKMRVTKSNPQNRTVKPRYSPVQPVKEPKDSGEVTAEHIQTIISKAEKQFQQAQLKKLEKDRQPWTWDNAKDIIRKLCKNEQEYMICKQSTSFKTADLVKT